MTVDPRSLAAKLRNDLLGVVTYGDVIAAADLVERVVVPLHDAWLKANPPCPTCGGDGELAEPLGDCPDCSDGVLPFDKWTAGLVKVWQRVWMFPVEERVATWAYSEGWQACIDHLRQIGGTR